MKYMTSDLIIRGQSHDPAELDAVEAAWESHGEQYRLYLDQIRSELPMGLLRFLDGYVLHDARILAMSQAPGQFHILVQLDAPNHSFLGLRYDVVGEAHITENVLPPEVASQGEWVEWWYDEIEQVPGSPSTWRHSILLSNGWEIQLHCRDVRLEEATPLLPRVPSLVAAQVLSG